jgi:hypothetical protein
MANRRDWLVPLTGLLFIVLVFVGFAVTGEPPEAKSHSGKEIAAFYVDNKSSVQIGAAIAAVACVALVFFFSYVRSRLREAEAARAGAGLGMLPNVAFAGAVIFAAGVAVDSTVLFATADAAKKIDPTAVQALQALYDNDFLPIGLGVALMMLGSGLAIVRHGGLPVWLGWAAVLFGVISVTPIGFAGFIGAGLWVLVSSVVMALGLRKVAPGAEARA